MAARGSESSSLTKRRGIDVHPYLREWLLHGQPVTGNLPRDVIIEIESSQLLADRAGAFTTTAPLSYAPEVAGPEPTAPPIRFGGNLTLLGYEPDAKREFLPGESVDVITYWRVEGDFLPDIILKNHILADPVTPIGIRDIISVNPLMLRERDVFIQVTPLKLRETTLPGKYIVSVGAYRQSDQDTLARPERRSARTATASSSTKLKCCPPTASDEGGA